jgi:hypothetical protein
MHESDNITALLAYRNEKGELRTTFVAKAQKYIIETLDTCYTNLDVLTELGYHGALESLGETVEDCVFYQGLLQNKIPCKQKGWPELIKAIKDGDYYTTQDLDYLIVFDGTKWIKYSCYKTSPDLELMEKLAFCQNPKGRYEVTVKVKLNAVSLADAELMVLHILRRGNSGINHVDDILCRVGKADRNLQAEVTKALERSAPKW